MNMQANKAEQWYQEQVVEVLYGNVKGAILGSSINITLVSFVLWPIYPTYGLLIWFILGQVLNLFRLYISIRYESDRSLLSIKAWLNIHRVLTCISGAMYGILAFFFFSSEHPLHQILVILLAGGMGAAAVGTHSVDRITYQSFLFSAVVPLIFRSYMEGTDVHMVVSAMLCLLMLIMLRAANQSKQIMVDNIYMSQSLRYRATHDSLVDLLNREEFQKEYNRLKNSLVSDSKTTSMIFIDLDNFKSLNDTFGHQAGDDALIKISEIIRNCIRQSDIAARFGGDEFMILLQSDSVEQATIVAEKVLLRIAHFQKTFQEEDIMFGASIGIGYSNNPACSFEALLKAADKACYKAKNDGKGRTCIEEVNNDEKLKLLNKHQNKK
jgi:diguanylate cyclase (GGDEF)-like protein